MATDKAWIKRLKNCNNPIMKNLDNLSVEKFEGYYIITDGDFKGAFIYPKDRIIALNSVYSEKEVQDFKSKISKNMEWL